MKANQKLKLLEEYFNASKQHFKIGNGELMIGREYIDKVAQMNFLYNEQRRIEKLLDE